MIDAQSVRWSAPASDRAGRPVLLVLHGHGLDEQVGSNLWDRLPPELVVAGLRGPLRARGGYGWFRMDATLRPADIDAAADSVLTWLDAQQHMRSLGVLGFSQGSAVAIQALRRQPDRFDYVVVLSGFMAPLPAAGDTRLVQRRPAVFAARGDQDRLVPAFLVSQTDQWLAEHTTLTSHCYPGLGHTVSDTELADLRRFLDTQLSMRPTGQ